MKTTLQTFFLLAMILLFISCGEKKESGQNDDTNPTEVSNSEAPERQGQAFIKDDESQPTVLDIAIGSKDHTILVKAVQAAQLENVLVNAGPLMVFAPTDAAFKELPEETLNDLMKPENKEKLAYILKHHVTPGNYNKEFLKKFKKLGQASDQSIPVEVKGDDVYVGGAKILASVPAGNGIVHVVDKVILPENSN
ncbi:putative surface protein with fasciclin (FAS1) repeats [Gillisia sp. Hel_I_86]|uniref:fasciclin domain-containing protein n=1 Tax=Gillisia sp. Hel_I_86 TaxID=1249981 RepID=UPI00119BBE77|nr:fasciclin domain-containing protein [Gillisia sp. Hel_I_86]TVZ27547.1 putative surface protein with fasciclin (FAS1) repeats [Gillisia sp. Hel_I_86]